MVSEDPDRYTKAALQSLRDMRWCFDHAELLFFCGHKHDAKNSDKKGTP